jgi:ABC-type transport system involved in cytochrome c biogenesis permease subunit
MQSLLFWSATTCYGVAAVFMFVLLALHWERGSAWGMRLACCGLLPHGGAILLRWAEVGHGPYNSRYEVLSANAFVLIVVYLVTVRVAPRLRGLGGAALPAAFLLMGWAASGFGVRQEVPIIFKSWWLILHIGFAKGFAATTVIAAGCAVGYLVKSAAPQRLVEFPSAERLELYAGQFLLLSFLLLGVMIAAGSLWAHQSWGRYWGWDPMETSSLVTWVVYGLILHGRGVHRVSGRSMAWLTLVALGFALVTLYVVVMVVPTIHNSYMVAR